MTLEALGYDYIDHGGCHVRELLGRTCSVVL